MMKDYIEANDPELEGGTKISDDELRRFVLEAQGSIDSEDLTKLIESISTRFQAMIDTDRANIPYWAIKTYNV